MSETKQNATEWLLAKYPDASPYTLGEWNDIDDMEAYASYVSAEKDAKIAELEKLEKPLGFHEALQALQLRAEAAEAQVRKYEEREAAVCPEDVGFEELIGVLRRQVKELEAALRWAKDMVFPDLCGKPCEHKDCDEARRLHAAIDAALSRKGESQ